MAYNTRYYNRGASTSGWFPPGVKWLLIANVAIFVLTFFARLAGDVTASRWYSVFRAYVCI